MKFAFSIECQPGWDFPTIADKAREYGYDGVEISGAFDRFRAAAGVSDAPGGLVLDDPASNLTLLGCFKTAGIDISCLAVPVRFTGDRRTDARGAGTLLQWIELAAALDCPRMMLRDPVRRRGISGVAAGIALGEWLAPAADHALDREITLVVCNDSTLTSARTMWTMLERLRHPAVACCWDLHNAIRMGESPSISVPTLNSQIRYVRVGGVAALSGGPTRREPISDSDVQLFLTRLRGIGYDGYVTAAGQSTELAATEEYLRNMAATMKKWGTRAPSAMPGRRKQETRPKAG